MAGVGAVVVFLHANVLLAMEYILDAPVIADRLSRRCRWQTLCRCCGEGVDGFRRQDFLSLGADAGAFDLVDLADVWEDVGQVVGMGVDNAQAAHVFTAVAASVLVGGRGYAGGEEGALNPVEKTRCIAFDDAHREPPFSTMAVMVVRLVWAASMVMTRSSMS